jgi:Tol biopolymer transport system component
MVRPPRDRRRRARLLVALLGGSLALVLGCSKRDLPTAPGNDRPPLLLAFLSERPPSPAFSTDIYFYDLRSGGPAYLAPNLNTASIEGPCNLSADGKHLAFYTNRFPIGSSALLLLYDVTTGLTTVPRWTNTLLSVQNPALSGDGRYLAVQYTPSTAFESYVAVEDLVGDSLLPVPNLNTPGGIIFDPFLSPDGQLLAASSTRAGTLGGFDIFLYSVPADSFLPLPGLNSTASDLAPSLSADGRYLAFQSGRPGGAGLIDVYVYDRQAGALIPLPGANTAMADYVPSISPDGRYLAYATESSGGRDVRVYDIQAQRLLDLPGLNDPYFYDYFPSFANR